MLCPVYSMFMNKNMFINQLYACGCDAAPASGVVSGISEVSLLYDEL